ncbi:MAG: MBL fold metallo-hydrolase [Bacteroidetes bacterium]|nr:MBL fold metallo-hydrolase [Bacteroidota bacterium]
MKLFKIAVLLYCAILLTSIKGGSIIMMEDDSQGQEEVTITYLQNDGVLITDGTKKVLIDAIFNPLSGWINLDPAENSKLTNAQAPYDDVDLVLITHNHGDHYSISNVNTHMNNNSNGKVIAPPQVMANFSGPQFLDINPAFGESESLIVNGIELEVLHIRHFDAFGIDFSDVKNFGYLINIGGFNILHLGDVFMSVENLQNFGLAEKGIDVVLIPTFHTPAHLMNSHREALISQVQPANIIALHLLSGSIAVITQQVNDLYPGATIFSEPLQSFTLGVTSVDETDQIPENFSLAQNYPNPFNPSTTIEYSLAHASSVVLIIYDVLGNIIRTLVNAKQIAGRKTVIWNGRNDEGDRVGSGMYFYEIVAENMVQVKKMILIK